MKKHEKVFAAFVMLAFLLPNAYTIYQGKESYPFTPAPMFGHYVGDSTHFYSFQFTANGKPFAPDNLSNLMLKRMFFDKVYWSVDPKSPLGHFDNDSKPVFEQRLSKFFSTYVKYLTTDTTIHTIQLSVNQYDRKYRQLDAHTVGYYNHDTKRFTQTWKEK
ncbi:MAG: hypothetical protein ABIN95_11745 [Mucilaginibacter sp.]